MDSQLPLLNVFAVTTLESTVPGGTLRSQHLSQILDVGKRLQHHTQEVWKVLITTVHPLSSRTSGSTATRMTWGSTILVTIIQPSYDPPPGDLGSQDLQNLGKATVTSASPRHVGGDPSFLLSGPSPRTCSRCRMSVIPSLLLSEEAWLLFLIVTWQRQEFQGQRAWMCFPAPLLTIARTSVGKGCHFACCHGFSST